MAYSFLPSCELLNLQDVLSQEQMERRTVSVEENYQLLHSCPLSSWGCIPGPAHAQSSNVL